MSCISSYRLRNVRLFTFSILYDQKENVKLILLHCYLPGKDLDIEYVSKKVYIYAYLSIDKTDEYS